MCVCVIRKKRNTGIQCLTLGKFFECFTSSIDYHIINGGGGGGSGDAPQLIRTGDGMNIVNGDPYSVTTMIYIISLYVGSFATIVVVSPLDDFVPTTESRIIIIIFLVTSWI